MSCLCVPKVSWPNDNQKCIFQRVFRSVYKWDFWIKTFQLLGTLTIYQFLCYLGFWAFPLVHCTSVQRKRGGNLIFCKEVLAQTDFTPLYTLAQIEQQCFSLIFPAQIVLRRVCLKPQSTKILLIGFVIVLSKDLAWTFIILVTNGKDLAIVNI